MKDLRTTLAKLEAERDRMTQEAESFRRVIAYYEGHPLELETLPPKEARNQAMQILQDETKPLHYKEIYEHLLKRGIRVGGQMPAKNLGAQMSQDSRFVSLGRGMWGLASWGACGGTVYHGWKTSSV